MSSWPRSASRCRSDSFSFIASASRPAICSFSVVACPWRRCHAFRSASSSPCSVSILAFALPNASSDGRSPASSVSRAVRSVSRDLRCIARSASRALTSPTCLNRIVSSSSRFRFAAFSRTDWPTSSNRFSSVSVNRTASSWRNASIFASEGAERGLPVDVGPERGDLAMELVDPVLGLVASLLVLVLREVELPPCRARGGLALLVVRLRFLQPVPFLPEAIEVFDFFLEGGSLRLEFGGDLTLVSDFCLAGLQGFQPRRAVLEGRRRPHPPFVLRLEILHLPGAGFEGGLELRDARSSLFALLIQTSELFLQCGEAAERFLPRGDLGILRLDVPLHGGESFLRPLQGLFEDLKPEEFLKHREPLRPARGPELLHLLLPDEGGVPESIVVETDHVADRPLLVRDRPLHRLPVTRDFEVRFLLGREAAGDVPPFVTLVERQADVSVRTTHVRELYALDIRPGRLAVQGERDGVQDRRFPRARAARDYGVFLRKPERRDRLLEVSHEPAHLDFLEDETLRTGCGLPVRDRGGLDLRIGPHARASLSTRRASTLIASLFGWSARTLST